MSLGKCCCDLKHDDIQPLSELTHNVFLSDQLRAARVVVPTHLTEGDAVPEARDLHVAPEILGLEEEGLAYVRVACGPVESSLLGVRLVGVVKVRVGGLTHDHLPHT